MMAANKEPEEETITMLASDHEFAIHEAHVDGAANGKGTDHRCPRRGLRPPHVHSLQRGPVS